MIQFIFGLLCILAIFAMRDDNKRTPPRTTYSWDLGVIAALDELDEEDD